MMTSSSVAREGWKRYGRRGAIENYHPMATPGEGVFILPLEVETKSQEQK